MSLHRFNGLAAMVAASIWLAAGCTRPAPPTETAAAAATRPGAFPRQQLIEDARELAAIIEATHPDPYSGGGGRIAFHRRLHQALNAIPDETSRIGQRLFTTIRASRSHRKRSGPLPNGAITSKGCSISGKA